MCEYCDDDCRSRRTIELSEGHEIEIDKENDLFITVKPGWEEERIFLEIYYCPWCGRALGDEK
ncbi:hypothetical protein ACWKH1_000800 [Listeria monocytogenes]|uniref:Uncharacterized protein n=1 Tax=Listeria monocytogenes TaxID=1639 RepID=A0AAN2XCE8_LISMN|nr:hypothetical protein [Listeria monocytogenes]AWN07876.1 hypothetical protein [Listeria phage PSU-VKH-LP019]EAC6520357.1 hypothetical protein [Listeria monocytogenes serotype 4b]EAE1679044.1 hypothetical protein [Listeria monocytogenes LIS0071]EAF4592510.1 hypothetical protein [Listeria monocytogenes serotype 1/2a]EAA0119909.1 hypothetical protein [Listeria monocytogenes]